MIEWIFNLVFVGWVNPSRPIKTAIKPSKGTIMHNGNPTRLVIAAIIGCLWISCSQRNIGDEIVINQKIKEVQEDLRKVKNRVEGIFVTTNTYQIRDVQDTFPSDIFDVPGKTYKYFAFPDGQSYILSSNGPDMDNDLGKVLTPEIIVSASNVRSLIMPIRYDASNGLKSDGDIIILGP